MGKGFVCSFILQLKCIKYLFGYSYPSWSYPVRITDNYSYLSGSEIITCFLQRDNCWGNICNLSGFKCWKHIADVAFRPARECTTFRRRYTQNSYSVFFVWDIYMGNDGGTPRLAEIIGTYFLLWDLLTHQPFGNKTLTVSGIPELDICKIPPLEVWNGEEA